MLFHLLVPDIHSGIERALSKFAHGTKLWGGADTLEERDAIWKDLDRLDRWAQANLKEFNKAECKVLHLGRDKPQHEYSLRNKWVESSPAENDLGVLGEKHLNVSQQCTLAAQKASHLLGCTNRSQHALNYSLSHWDFLATTPDRYHQDTSINVTE